MFEINKKTLRNLFLLIAAGIILYWILHDTERVGVVYGVVKGIFSPFVLGAGLAFVLNVPMRAFEGLLKKIKRQQLRRLIAVVLTFIALLLVVAMVFWLLIPQLIVTVNSLIPALQTFFTNAQVFVTDILNKNPQLMDWVIANTNFENFDVAVFAEKMLSVFSSSVSTIVGGAFSAISIVFGGVVDFVIALVFSIYALFQKETLARQGRKLLYAFLPEKASDHIVRILRLSNSTFSNFLSGQCVEVCILGGLFAIAMAIFKMPYIPLISILIAVTAFIPIVGAFIGCIVGAFLIFVNDPLQAVIFVAMFLVIQQVENNLIYPRVVGTSIGLNGMWVLVAVAVGGELFGVAGMFLMIPVASVIYTLLREVTNKRLNGMQIDPEKLKDQPPELRSHFKEKQKINKAKRQKRRFERIAKRAEKN
ncbi:MAG: AI-2E family transporter [Oscillospiraceae bacterium]|nr:AI-2E family transporter [Oscillospiraceae bacterium]